MSFDPGLEAILRSLASGGSVDWSRIDSGRQSPSDAPLIRELKILERITAFHETLQNAEDVRVGSSTDVDSSAHAPQQHLESWGSLTLISMVGSGSFGDVYRAWDRRLDREVALKLTRSADPRTLHTSAFIEEGRLLARTRHPNVITVYGAEQHDGRVGIWTEFIHGRTLEQLLREHGPFSAQETASIGIDLCRALAAVHHAGLLHGDIKAQNVMREIGGRIVLMDFGAGEEHPDRTGRPSDGRLTGTPLYLAPERFDGRGASVLSDIYGLGVLLAYLATGVFPVGGATLEDIRSAHAKGRHTSLRDARPDLPDAFVGAVERAIDPDPDRRYQTAGMFESALKDVQPDRGPSTRPWEAPREPTPARRQDSIRNVVVAHPWLAAACATLIVAAAIALIPSAISNLHQLLPGGRPVSSAGPPASHPQPVAAGSPTTVRKLVLPEMMLEGKPSPDGCCLPYSDQNGDLAYLELATGRPIRVTNKGDSDEMAEDSVMSSDGRIAYAWWTLDGADELRVIDVQTKRIRLLLRRPDVDTLSPLQWAHDGRRILCKWRHPDGTGEIALVDADAGTVSSLLTLPTSPPRHASLSPDDRFLLYDLPRPDGSGSHEMYVVGTDRSQPKRLLNDGANNLFPLWTPDGGHVFFASDRSGSMDGWVMPIVNGTASGDPTLVVRNIGRVEPLAITNGGAYYYMLQAGAADIYTARIADDSSESKPTLVSSRFAGSNLSPFWSSDSRYLAYISLRVDRIPTITIRDVASGSEMDLHPPLARLGMAPPQWSSDNRQLLIRGADAREGSFRYDVDTGRLRPGVLIDRVRNLSDYGPSHWNSDGRSIVYEHAGQGLVSRDVESGAETVLLDYKTEGIDRIQRFGISPDGSTMAFSFWIRDSTPPVTALMVKPVGAPVRELFKGDESEVLVFQDWMPNGEEILFTRLAQAGKRSLGVWRLSIAGGAPREIRLGLDRFLPLTGSSFVVSPDGRHVAFGVGSNTLETWVMENFLPGFQTALHGEAR